jgi:hypothetical protein
MPVQHAQIDHTAIGHAKTAELSKGTNLLEFLKLLKK